MVYVIGYSVYMLRRYKHVWYMWMNEGGRDIDLIEWLLEFFESSSASSGYFREQQWHGPFLLLWGHCDGLSSRLECRWLLLTCCWCEWCRVAVDVSICQWHSTAVSQWCAVSRTGHCTAGVGTRRTLRKEIETFLCWELHTTSVSARISG